MGTHRRIARKALWEAMREETPSGRRSLEEQAGKHDIYFLGRGMNDD